MVSSLNSHLSTIPPGAEPYPRKQQSFCDFRESGKPFSSPKYYSSYARGHDLYTIWQKHEHDNYFRKVVVNLSLYSNVRRRSAPFLRVSWGRKEVKKKKKKSETLKEATWSREGSRREGLRRQISGMFKGAVAWLIVTRQSQQLWGPCRGQEWPGAPSSLVVLISLRAWPCNKHTACALAHCRLGAHKIMRPPDRCYCCMILSLEGDT